ncbi:MAG: 5-formyltetrahydrofolate cyclo-ligase [Gemmatimonadota bacterium]|nr:5-formyltetrahydrofolate cyclo-ligase [Gemmatimonadota bacterium]
MIAGSVAEAKAELRREVLERRRSLSPEERSRRSTAIARRLLSLSPWTEAGVVHAFVGIDGEVETLPLLREALAAGKRVVCPRVVWRERRLESLEIGTLDELVESDRGLMEPDPARARRVREDERIDLVLVPGVAFDRAGGRIGYGAGFYDRFLETTEAERVGLAFSLQVIDTVPTEPHDAPVDRIVTEEEAIVCRSEPEPEASPKPRREEGS